ncbi:DUF6941 family protein [Aerococcaceae bacterium WGS1372]
MAKNYIFGNITLAKRTHRNQNIVLENPILVLDVPFLPTTVSFSVFGAVFTQRKKERYFLKVKLTDQSGFEVLNIDGDIFDTNSTNEFSILDINIDVDGAIFKTTGKHTCQLIVDDEIIDEYSFFVNNQNLKLDGGGGEND